jgi:uncharacterized protein YgfB (UPF0149 family)
MPAVDLESLPSGPLSMAGLLALEPAELRRLLKGGLRRGLSTDDLQALLEQDWQAGLEAPPVQALLAALQQRGWFRCDGDRWKTHLG